MERGIFFPQLLRAMKQSGMSAEEAGKFLVGRGIFGVTDDLALLTPERIDLLRRTGLRLDCVYFVCDLLHGHDGDAAEQAVHDSIRLGAGNLMLVPGFSDGMHSDRDEIETALPLIDRAVRAAQGELFVTLEDYGGRDAPYNSPDGALRFLERIDGLKFVFDTGNFLYHRTDPLFAWEKLKNFTVQVHAKDVKRGAEGTVGMTSPAGDFLIPVAFGSGDLPAEELLCAMRRDGFSGILTLEHDGCPDGMAYIKESSDFLDRWEKSYADDVV